MSVMRAPPCASHPGAGEAYACSLPSPGGQLQAAGSKGGQDSRAAGSTGGHIKHLRMQLEAPASVRGPRGTASICP